MTFGMQCRRLQCIKSWSLCSSGHVLLMAVRVQQCQDTCKSAIAGACEASVCILHIFWVDGHISPPRLGPTLQAVLCRMDHVMVLQAAHAVVMLTLHI